MLVIIYIASIAVLLLACSVWAMRNKDRGAQAVFAGGAGLVCFLLIPTLGSGHFFNGEVVKLFLVGGLFLVAIFLSCHSLVRTLNDKR